MSRYRPPRAPRAAVITPTGERLMQEELDQLWRHERPIIVQTVSDAAKNGDRSENGDYIYGKKRLREIDSRVRFLRKRLDSLRVVDTVPSNPDKVYFGAWVKLLDEEDVPAVYRLVGPDEFDRQPPYISVDSPLARGIMGKGIDDEVVIQTPKGQRTLWIDAVAYSGEQLPAGW